MRGHVSAVSLRVHATTAALSHSGSSVTSREVARSFWIIDASRRSPILSNMSTKENNEVAVEKVTENDKASADAKCDIKGIKRPAEVSTRSIYRSLPSVLRSSFVHIIIRRSGLLRDISYRCKLIA